MDLADRAAWFKKGSGIVAGTARRVLRTTIPDPFLNHARNCDEMDVIGHQAVRTDLDLVGGAPLRHELQVRLVIFIAKERLLPAVSPLGDVVKRASSSSLGTRGESVSTRRHFQGREMLLVK